MNLQTSGIFFISKNQSKKIENLNMQIHHLSYQIRHQTENRNKCTAIFKALEIEVAVYRKSDEEYKNKLRKRVEKEHLTNLVIEQLIISPHHSPMSNAIWQIRSSKDCSIPPN